MDIDKLITQTIQIAKFIGQQQNATFEERASTILQYHTLSYLESNPKAKLGEVARHLNASDSSTTQLIERMYKGGLILRQGDEADRRIIHLSVTKEGLEKLQALKESKRERTKELLSHIGKDEVKELVRIQEKLIVYIQNRK